MHRFPPALRLTRKPDLELVRHEGKRFRTPHLEVRAVASLLRHPRVGIIVPRHKQTAVDRNRIKRRLRELARTQLLPRLATATSVDLVVRALPSAYAATFAELFTEVARVAERFSERLSEPRPERDAGLGAP